MVVSYTQTVRIPAEEVVLDGELNVPANAPGVVLFAHGSGSSRHSIRNQQVARTIREAGLATLLFDLLTPDEEAVDQQTRHLRFAIPLLAQRLSSATKWIEQKPETAELRIGYFGASTGAAAALTAAASLGDRIGAVVSRGGRPDLAGNALSHVTAPTLLLVGERDDLVIQLNEEAFERLSCKKELRLVPNATHLFEEPGALEEVAQLAAQWFRQFIGGR
ncbi:MAG: alpha/beta family hydrolase [Blastocatellia bacterium]|nr:alpha/beta family hydrolase [Blastocatellia bacterium]